MNKLYQFNPFPFLKNPHLQTILSSVINWHQDPSSKSELFTLSDGDILSLQITTPQGWKQNNPTVILMHGLCGSHESPYLKRMASKLANDRIRAIRVNLRGCGSGTGLAKKVYHAGVSSDLFEVIEKIKEATPSSPIIVIGFSLSGNIALKLAGELGHQLDPYVEKIIAVCPSVALEDTVVRLQKRENRIYEKMFLNALIKSVLTYEHLNSYVKKNSAKACKNLFEFDEIFTAPSWGFKNAKDYYRKSSSLSLIPDISVPCHLLFAKDDPMIDPLPIQSIILPKNIQLIVTEYGGHMGFLGNPSNGDFYWMDSLLLHWTHTKNPIF